MGDLLCLVREDEEESEDHGPEPEPVPLDLVPHQLVIGIHPPIANVGYLRGVVDLSPRQGQAPRVL